MFSKSLWRNELARSIAAAIAAIAAILGSPVASDIAVSAINPAHKAVVSGLTSARAADGSEPKEIKNMSPGDFQKRGTELRAMLQQTYQNFVDTSKLSPLETDITQYVRPYIPAGTSFEEAESILRAAGFRVNSRPKADEAMNPNKARDWYGVLASISPFSEGFFRKVSVYVTLYPKSPGDYTTVENIAASFFVSMP